MSARCAAHGNLVWPADKPFPPGQSDYCHLCWRSAQPVRVSLPCVHVGDPAGPKGWYVCNHPDEPLGMVTCSCKGCGVRCPGYQPATVAHV